MLKRWVLPTIIGLLHHRCVYVFVCVCVLQNWLAQVYQVGTTVLSSIFQLGRLYSLEMSNLDYLTFAIYLVFSVCIWFI